MSPGLSRSGKGDGLGILPLVGWCDPPPSGKASRPDDPKSENLLARDLDHQAPRKGLRMKEQPCR